MSLGGCSVIGRLLASAPLIGALAVAHVMVAPVAAHAEGIEKGIAVLRWLDKSTARVATVEVPVNQSVRIESLELIVRACVERPPVEPPESAAFLDVAEVRPGEPTAEVFRGWMFASSPALSAMEHPIYDVWVLDCIDAGETSPFVHRLEEDQNTQGKAASQ
jgi:hypothetical protein